MTRSFFALLAILAVAGSAPGHEVLMTSDFTDSTEAWETGNGKVPEASAEGLRFAGKDRARFRGDVAGLTGKIRQSNTVTIESWITPESLNQGGPARIFTFSKNTSERNFTLGQEGDRIEARLRTSRTGSNGVPGLQSPKGSLKTEATHVVVTRDRSGTVTLFLNGEPVLAKRIPGDLSNWDASYGLAVGDELSGGRGWSGRVSAVTICDGALSETEVRERYRAGPGGDAAPTGVSNEEPTRDPNVELFETKITTLLTQRCLECHDSSTREGDLDLSRKLAAHTELGIVVGGDAAGSLLWESIEHDDMPHKREPLSPHEKALVKEWLDGGAAWTVDFIDPAIYGRPDEVAPQRTARLTSTEYVATVRDTFGVDVSEQAARWLPAEVRTDGFSNTAYNLTVDLEHVEAHARLAEWIVGELDVGKFAKRFSGKRDLTDKTMIPLIEAMGQEVLRGPLDEAETAVYRGVSTTVASAGGDFDEAVAYVLEAMLQSPRFVYRIEDVRGDGRRVPAGDFEVASRLSYILWGSSPDEELRRLAQERRLNNEETIRSQARRMLKDPRAVDRSLEFVAEWLHLDRLSHLQPSPEKFPDWKPELATAMRNETLAFFRELVWERREPLSNLLNAPFSHLTPDLAAHYGLEGPASGDGLRRVDLRDEPARGGLLTHGSVLTVGGDEASMVTRGLFVLHDLLRGVIQDPPPCVDTAPKPSQPGLTQRAIAMERVASKSCGGCHSKFEPLAYGMEKFDGLGGYHQEDEHGNPLREDGEVLFPGEPEPVPFESVGELMDLLAESARVKETLTWKLTQFAMGRPLVARDAPAVHRIHRAALEAGGRYTDVMCAIVESGLVREVVTEPESDSSP